MKDKALSKLIEEFRNLSKHGGDSDGFMSVAEMAPIVGHDDHWVRTRLRILHQAGRLEVRRRKDERIDGALQSVPVYRIKAEAKS